MPVLPAPQLVPDGFTSGKAFAIGQLVRLLCGRERLIAVSVNSMDASSFGWYFGVLGSVLGYLYGYPEYVPPRESGFHSTALDV